MDAVMSEPALYEYSRPAFVFDIDGVLVKGAQPILFAKATIEFLQSRGIPYIFLTNGGGHSEAAHAAKLASRLDVLVDPRQFVQSHTPFHDLVGKYEDKPILVLGGTGDQIRNVALEYGFKKVITSSDIFLENDSLHPFPELTREKLALGGKSWVQIGLDKPIKDTSIAAIMVWSSPRDWCLDLQLTLDLLLSKGGVLNTRSPKNGTNIENKGYLQDGQPMLHFCNPDFKWATQAPLPRLAQGGFKAALEGLWLKETGGAELYSTVCGKPTEESYRYAEEALSRWIERDEPENFERDEALNAEHTVYMVGDNPASDIQGANAYVSKKGYAWKSILVETGVYQKSTKPEFEPTYITEDVRDAVCWAVSRTFPVLNKREEDVAGVIEMGSRL